MLDNKSKEKIIEIGCTNALTRLKRTIPYGWDLNLYKGCSHQCKYCYAIYSQDVSGTGDFSIVAVKKNIVELLEQELSSPDWRREIVNIGGVTDSYQAAEAEMRLMPEVLRLFIKYKTPAIISTKSDLIFRDYDLIAELATLTYVNIASTITTMDETVRRKIEPYGSPGPDRFAMLKEFRKTNASTGLHVMPIIPYITDSYENIEQLCSEAAHSNVHYMLPGALYLRGASRKVFFDFILKEFPDKYESLKQLYKTGGAGNAYKEKLYGEIVNPLRKKYNISSSYIKVMKEKLPMCSC